MEIDHIYICTEAKAPVGDKLVEFGLIEGSSNTHPGQGTACRRFYFHNLMLELLWVEDLEAVQSELTRPMRLFERCMQRTETVSPFGIALRPTVETGDSAPFLTWDYHPIYLPDFLRMQVADQTPLSEPMYFYLSFAGRQDRVAAEKREPMEHKVRLKEVTAVKIYVKQECALSEAAGIIKQLKNVSIELGREHFIELEFDCGTQNQYKDFRPELPLAIRW